MKLGSLHFDYTRKVYSKFQTASYHALSLVTSWTYFNCWNFRSSSVTTYFFFPRYKLSSGGNAEDDITENSYFLMYVGRLMVKRVLKTRRRRFKNLISSLVSITSLLTSLTVLLLNVKLLHCSSSVFFLFLFFF